MLIYDSNVKSVLLNGSESCGQNTHEEIGSFPQWMSQMHMPDLLAQQNLQPRTLQENWEQDHHQGNHTQTFETARTCAENGQDRTPHTRQKKTWEVQNHMAQDSDTELEQMNLPQEEVQYAAKDQLQWRELTEVLSPIEDEEE